MEVTLQQILSARENRVRRQKELLSQFHKPLISFSMNIPGPVKNSPLIQRAFREGLESLEAALPENAVVHREILIEDTGCQALMAADLSPLELKTITTEIEDTHGLGRLFDMDVLDISLQKLDRDLVGGKRRDCIVCGAPGRGCASRRIHSVPQLQQATGEIMIRYFRENDPCRIGRMAVQALLDEVQTTPKPGLVDRNNTGSHGDMDADTFRRSALALEGYFRECAKIGMDTSGEIPRETFLKLRAAGILAEETMYRATNGVNTHKGAIFTLGLLCGAAGRLWRPHWEWDENALLSEISAMTREEMESDWQKGGQSAGMQLFERYGIRGIRGEAALGMPSVRNIGLPQYRKSQSEGMSPNDAGVRTLLALIAQVEDTNMIRRGGRETAKKAAEMAAQVLEAENWRSRTENLDAWFIQHNLSPGGCADLLAAVYFLVGLTNN